MSNSIVASRCRFSLTPFSAPADFFTACRPTAVEWEAGHKKLAMDNI